MNEDKEDVTENNEAQVNLALDLNEDKKESASEPEHISLKDEDLQLNLGDEIEFDLDDIDLEFKIEKEETDEVDERFNILDSDIDLSFEDESK